MTQHHDAAFTPDTVDERVDQLASLAPQSSSPPSARVVQRLHALYEEDQQSTERVWERLMQHVNEHDDSDIASEYRQPGSLSGIQEGRGSTQQGPLSFRKRGPTRLVLVAAMLFATLLVSSLLWIVQLSHSTSAAIPIKPLVAPTSPPGIYIAKPGEISRLNVQTRKVIWRTTIPAKAATKLAGEPVIIGNTLYLLEVNTVSGFDANKGTFLWMSHFDMNVGSVSLVDGLLYVAPPMGSKLYAVNPANGKIKATYISPQGEWYAPKVVNGVVYYSSSIGGPNTNLYALRLADKKLLWHQQFGADQEIQRVDVKNGVVYSLAAILGTSSAGLISAFDANTGKTLWTSSTPGTRGLVIINDMVYCSSDRDLDAFDSYTGKHMWSLRNISVDGNMLVNVGVLYVTTFTDSTNGPTDIIALRGKDGKLAWRNYFIGNHILLGIQSGVLYTITYNSKASSIDAFKIGDGTRLWQMPINGDAIATVA